MKEQNYKNHSRLVFGFHGVTAGLILLFLIGSVINLLHSEKSNLYSASLLVVVAVICLLLFWYMRVFALKAQDRAIKTEENLRHFILTGNPLPAHLSIHQIIALRFAKDDEFVQLAAHASKENLSPKSIKQSIKDWKADYYRV